MQYNYSFTTQQFWHLVVSCAVKIINCPFFNLFSTPTCVDVHAVLLYYCMSECTMCVTSIHCASYYVNKIVCYLCSGVIEGGRQVLDHLPVERERGITVKAQTASMIYQYSGHRYLLNLIDTPVSHHVLSYISSTCNIQKECIYTQVCNCHSISNGETICTT